MMEMKSILNSRSLPMVCLLLLLIICPAAAQDVTDIFSQDVPQMTTLECAKCHLQVFEALRDTGGLHKQQCRDCHDKFHTLSPGVPWEERVPSCSSCHDYPHAEEMNDCLSCHKNAHAPIDSLVASGEIADLCDRCHQEPLQELAQADNAHGGQACADCHEGERHGERPQCNVCHEEVHTAFVDNAGCVACHPAHEPTRINYGTEIPNQICAGCHADQHQVQQASQKKHKLLACVVCHAKEHGNITSCQQCHDNGPHNPTLLKNFTSCSDCHGDPHRLKL